MYLKTLLILSVTFCAVTTLKLEEYKFPGSCPKVKYLVDLNFSRILGFWYRCFSSLDTKTCLKNEGETVYAYPLNSSVAGVAICCRSAEHKDQVICSPEVGTGFIRPLPDPGKFNYEADGQTYLHVVLEADDNFLISYGCKPKRGRNDGLDELIYIYSRSYEQCASLERRSRSVLQRNGISWSSVKTVKHGSSTPYTPVPKPCPKS